MVTKELVKKHKVMEIKRKNELRRKSMADQAKVKKFLREDIR